MSNRYGRGLPLGVLSLVLALVQLPALAESPPFSNKEIGFMEKMPKTSGFARLRTDVLGSIKTVGVMPMDGLMAAGIPGGPEALTRIEQEMVARLQEAGFKVVPPDELRASRETAAAAVGKLFDPITGEADELKLEQYQQSIWKDYRSRHQVDGYVFSALVTRSATESQGSSEWDGATDSTTGLGALANFMSGSKRQMAVVPALSVAVWLTDTNMNMQYLAAGGLHLLMYLRKPPGAPVDYVEVAPAPELFTEPRIMRAMDAIFDPIYKSTAQREAERRKPGNRPTLKYAPALSDRAPDGTEFISATDFLNGYKRVLVMPLQWKSDARRGERTHAFERQLAERLTALDKAVIPPDRLVDAFAAEFNQPVERFNPRNGTFNPDSLQASRERAFASIEREAPFDAILYPSLELRPAIFESGEAHWLGTQQAVTGDATTLQAKLSSAGQKLGTTTALALQLRLTDRAGKALHVGMGGIELTQVLGDNGFLARSEWDLLGDKQRNAAAIDFALKRLLQAEPRK
ncbi:MAG TPA: hypothetical protein VIU34_02210 [Steroidobacter sp.]